MQRFRNDTRALQRTDPEADGLPDGKTDGTDRVALAGTHHGNEGARDGCPDDERCSYHGTIDTVG